MLKEAMYKRHSRRSYLREKLRDEDAAFLKERIHMYNQKHGLHMKLVCGHPEIFKGFRNSYGMFHNVENFIMMMGNSRDVYMQEKLGYFGERLILEAVERNMGTCWVGGTFAKDALKPYVKEDEKLYCVIAIGYTAHKKTLKEQLISHATRHRGKTVEEMSDITAHSPDWMKTEWRQCSWHPQHFLNSRCASVRKRIVLMLRLPIRIPLNGGFGNRHAAL